MNLSPICCACLRRGPFRVVSLGKACLLHGRLIVSDLKARCSERQCARLQQHSRRFKNECFCRGAAGSQPVCYPTLRPAVCLGRRSQHCLSSLAALCYAREASPHAPTTLAARFSCCLLMRMRWKAKRALRCTSGSWCSSFLRGETGTKRLSMVKRAQTG